MCRKRFEPFKCDYVPTNAIVVFCNQNKSIVKAVYEQFIKDRGETGWHRRSIYRTSPQAKVLKSLLLLKFNFADSYLSTGDIVYRVMRIYDEHFSENKVFSYS